MSQILWTNAASTTLATAISSVSTTINVASGSGALFPNPGSNQYFMATLSPATPGAQPSEIVLVSARSSDALTVTRAQEGTTAQAWGTGAIVQNLITAGTMNALGQVINYAGNPNGYVAGAAGAGIIAPSIVWDSSNNLMWICTASGTTSTAQWSAQAPIVSPAFSGAPTAPTPTGSDNSTKLSTTAFVQTAIATRALLAGSTSQAFSVAAGASASQAVNFGQFPSSLSSNGYQVFPGGLIVQWGYVNLNYTTPGSIKTFVVSLPRNFVSGGIATQASYGALPPVSGSIGIIPNGVSSVIIGINAPGGSASYGVNFLAFGV